MKKIFSLVSLCSFFLLNCQGDAKSPNVVLRPVQPPGKEYCEPGCNHLKELHCKVGEGPNPSDPNSCKDACLEVMNGGIVLWPECWARAQNCDDVDKVCKK